MIGLSNIGLVLGWSTCMLLIIGCSYSVIKRSKSIRSRMNLSIKNLTNYHCCFSIIATILAFIHAGNNLINIRSKNDVILLFYTGCVTLFLMLSVTTIGMLMKYFKKAYIMHKQFWLYTHILLAIMLIGTILLHIFIYLILSLE